ncbi:hypothetical protein DFR79_106136 [Halanaerobium saccharolyticum]|uniref:Uncharacterized protein n=1 Tax=Halanaerobium saccharolyticum TaxID=43595 RepID=A0A4R6LUF9_9FIRM|nr:hypothetical protein [Halanaerobium saccharolyticum]TDO92323.1 hypothetical protein DFR79_106136 [Halanaerobium saccharolyticum]
MNKFKEFLNDSILKDLFIHYLQNEFEFKITAIGAHDIAHLYSREPNTYETREKIRNDFRYGLAMKYGRNYKRMIENEIKNLFGVM